MFIMVMYRLYILVWTTPTRFVDRAHVAHCSSLSLVIIATIAGIRLQSSPVRGPDA